MSLALAPHFGAAAKRAPTQHGGMTNHGRLPARCLVSRGLAVLSAAAGAMLLEAALDLTWGLQRPVAGAVALAIVVLVYLPLDHRVRARQAASRRSRRHRESTDRRRLARDLHEDIGARMLQQLHSDPNPESAARTRRALNELRALIDTLDDRPFDLDECVDEWRAQLQELCETHALPLRFDVVTALPRLPLRAEARSNPMRILMEFVDNAARPSGVDIAVAVSASRLHLVARHDGATCAPTAWRGGRGLRNMLLRAEDLGGSLQWRMAGPERVEMGLAFTLHRPD